MSGDLMTVPIVDEYHPAERLSCHAWGEDHCPAQVGALDIRGSEAR